LENLPLRNAEGREVEPTRRV